MSDRDYVHPLLLSAAITCEGDEYHEWSEAGQPILAPHASRVLAAVEKEMATCDKVANGRTCGECQLDRRHHCSPGLIAVRRAWKEQS